MKIEINKEKLAIVKHEHNKKWSRISNPFIKELLTAPNYRVFVPVKSINNAISLNKNKDRKTIKEIEFVLGYLGYERIDMKEKIAYKKNDFKNPIKIGKLLTKHNFPKNIIENWCKIGNSIITDIGNLSICYSLNPLDILLASTGRNWTSCLDAKNNGSYNILRKELLNLEKFAFIAYLVNNDDVEIKKPFGRCFINGFLESAEKCKNFVFCDIFYESKTKKMGTSIDVSVYADVLYESQHPLYFSFDRTYGKFPVTQQVKEFLSSFVNLPQDVCRYANDDVKFKNLSYYSNICNFEFASFKKILEIENSLIPKELKSKNKTVKDCAVTQMLKYDGACCHSVITNFLKQILYGKTFDKKHVEDFFRYWRKLTIIQKIKIMRNKEIFLTQRLGEDFLSKNDEEFFKFWSQNKEKLKI